MKLPPGRPHLIQHEAEPENSELPMAYLSGWLTPVELLYRRNHLPYPAAWRLWQYKTPALRPGSYRIVARATDAAGHSQPAKTPWNALGYGNHDMPVVNITVGYAATSGAGRRRWPPSV
ncbi:MAG: hypothetical protein ACM3XM_04610 [Mycobacterium leprae]